MAKKSDVRELLLTLRDEAKRGYEHYEEQFRQLEKGFIAELEKDIIDSLKKRKKTHIAQQIIKAKVRKLEISILKTYFSSKELAVVQDDTNEELGKALQSELDKYLEKKINLYTLIRPTIRDSIVYGTGAMKVYWSIKENKMKLQSVKITDIFYDPHADNIYDIKYAVHRFYMTIDDIKKSFKIPKGLDLESYVNKNRDLRGAGIQEQDSNLGGYQRVQLYEIYRKIDNIWTVSTLLDDVVIRQDIKLKDGFPFIIGNIYPQFVGMDEYFAVRSYGDSFIAPLIPLQMEYIIRRNQQIDAIDLQLNPRYLATKSSGLREDELSGNFKKISVTSIDQVKEVPYPNISQSMFDVEKIDAEIQEISGITKFSQGLQGVRAETATGISILTEESNEVIEDVIRSLNETFFEPLIFRMLTLIFKYEYTDSFKGFDRTKNITPTVSINAGVGAVNKDMKIKNIDNMLMVLTNVINLHLKANNLEQVYGYTNIMDSLVLEKGKILGIRDIKTKLEEGKQYGREKQQQLEQQLAQQQLKGGNI